MDFEKVPKKEVFRAPNSGGSSRSGSGSSTSRRERTAKRGNCTRGMAKRKRNHLGERRETGRYI